MEADPITYIGHTNARKPYRRFGIRQNDRPSHFYIIGRTGVGKSTMLEYMSRQDMENGEGLTLLDPHGDLVRRLAAMVPEYRSDDVVYFDVTDPEQPYGYNPLRRIAPERRALAASGMMEVFRKLWGERAWGQRMEYIFRNVLLALLDQPRADLTDVQRLLLNKDCRLRAAQNVTHPPVRDFWLKEYPKYTYRYRAEAIAPIQSKIGAFLADPRLHRIFVEPERPLSLRKIMDKNKVLLVNLSIGQIGADAAALLGGLLVTTVGLAAMSRADTLETQRRRHWLYVDEFQSFTTLSMANMLAELRKYSVGMIMSHQYLHQLDPDIRHAVLGNAGTVVSFRLGAEDASILARELAPVFSAADLINLPNYDMALVRGH
ncbi:MAG: type IV secretory system conjugative DNA transfer family protein [Magnetospiraceae bacterium]